MADDKTDIAKVVEASAEERDMQRLVKGTMDLLANFPANGKPDALWSETAFALSLGLISKHEVPRTCQHCGSRRSGSTYYKITKAGRALLAYFTTPETQRGEG